MSAIWNIQSECGWKVWTAAKYEPEPAGAAAFRQQWRDRMLKAHIIRCSDGTLDADQRNERVSVVTYRPGSKVSMPITRRALLTSVLFADERLP